MGTKFCVMVQGILCAFLYVQTKRAPYIEHLAEDEVSTGIGR